MLLADPNTKTTSCTHCGEACSERTFANENRQPFCCEGCRSVYMILQQGGLLDFYTIDQNAGSKQSKTQDRYDWLDLPDLAKEYIQYQDEEHHRVCLELPAIHCMSCVWLLENLGQLVPGVRSTQVNFGARRATILFDRRLTSLSDVATVLSNIGYPPEFRKLSKQPSATPSRQLIYRIGYSGFAFGNIMLLSLPEYFGLADDLGSAIFGTFAGYLMLLLSLPILIYAGSEYFKNAWIGLKRKELSIDVPIALGMTVLFSRSVYEIVSATGPGYLDSLSGLVFFLLIGRWFQSLTYERLSFDRDHRDYFPVAAYCLLPSGEISPVSVDELAPGQVVVVRPGQLIPADATLLNESAAPIDYSFVTGEAKVQFRKNGAVVFAGGRATELTLKVKIEKPAVDSYLLQLWREGESKQAEREVTLPKKMSHYFTILIISIAASCLLYWWPIDRSVAIQSATAVLIIACPCALSLTVPFAYGSMMRFLGKAGYFLRAAAVIDKLRTVDTFIFDKTGTLIQRTESSVPITVANVTPDQLAVVVAICQQSDHPKSELIRQSLLRQGVSPLPIGTVRETVGKGLATSQAGEAYRVGSRSFCQLDESYPEGTYATSNGFVLLALHHSSQAITASVGKMLKTLPPGSKHLLSGDSPPEEKMWNAHFDHDKLNFQQSPFDKERYVKKLQEQGSRVMMLGDGINDTGALRCAEVGFAVTENLSRFSPASDGIVLSSALGKLDRVIKVLQRLPIILYCAYFIAAVYNIVGLSYAVSGQLSPVIAAILMPLSSITVVAITVSLTWLSCRKISK